VFKNSILCKTKAKTYVKNLFNHAGPNTKRAGKRHKTENARFVDESIEKRLHDSDKLNNFSVSNVLIYTKQCVRHTPRKASKINKPSLRSPIAGMFAICVAPWVAVDTRPGNPPMRVCLVVSLCGSFRLLNSLLSRPGPNIVLLAKRLTRQSVL
jgi:hypothetical protein